MTIIDPDAVYLAAYQSFQAEVQKLRHRSDEDYIRQRDETVATRAEALVKEIPAKLDEAAQKGTIMTVLLHCDAVYPGSPYNPSLEAEIELRRSLEDRLVAEQVEKSLKDDKSVTVRRRYWSYDDLRAFSGFDLIVTANISEQARARIRREVTAQADA